MKKINWRLSCIVISIILASTLSACQLASGNSPTQMVIPTVDSQSTPEGLVSLSKIVNVDGFACAAAMAINIQMSSVQTSPKVNILCSDLIPSFEATANAHAYLRVPEWFIAETNAYINKKSFPLLLQHHPSASRSDLINDLVQDQGPLPIALVGAGCCFHAVVIVSYDKNKSEFSYLDSLRSKNLSLPYEDDFLTDYRITFQKAWIDTFELTTIK